MKKKNKELSLFWFYRMSTFEGYLILNIIYTYTLNIFVNAFCW